MGFGEKRSVRRKPPPDILLDVGIIKADVSFGEINNEVHDQKLQSSCSESPNSISNTYGTNISDNLFNPGEINASFNNEITNDETFISYNSPKPIGPKELEECSIYMTPTKTTAKQEKKLDSSIPYPINDFLEGTDMDDFSVRDIEFPLHTADIDEIEETSFTPLSRKEKIILDQGTPSKIPDLFLKTTLQFSDGSPKNTSNYSEYANDILSDESFNSTSPSSFPHYHSFEGKVTGSNSISYSKSALGNSPPGRPSLRNARTSLSAKLNPASDSYDTLYSRSSSPIKQSKYSPQFDTSYFSDEQFNTSILSNEESLKHIQDPDSFNRVDKLNGGGYSNLDTNNISFSSNFSEDFDYSALPELPSLDSKESPPFFEHKAFNSSLKDRSMKSISTFHVSKSRKDEKLPPVPLNLPKLPFSSGFLTIDHLTGFEAVWSLSCIYEWCLKLRTWISETHIYGKEFEKALLKLLAYHRKDVPLDIISQNSKRIFQSLLDQGAISITDSSNEPVGTKSLSNIITNTDLNKQTIVIREGITVSSIFTDLLNCYSIDKVHELNSQSKINLRCYAYDCHINKEISNAIRLETADISTVELGEDWVSHWKLTAYELAKVDKAIPKRQSLIFDLIKYEQTFIKRGKCFADVVGPEFIRATKTLLPVDDIISYSKFDDDVLSPAREIVDIHKKVLFEPLLKILISEGKFIQSINEIAEIYLYWAIAIKEALLKYIITVPMYEDLLKVDAVNKWIDTEVVNMERVKELKVNGSILFLSTFNSRYQQLPLQLQDIKRKYDPQDSEYISLTKAIDTIRDLGRRVNQMKSQADNFFELKKLRKQLTWKNNITHANINLTSKNRRFIYRGELMKRRELKINNYVIHIILLDNYLLLTEKIKGSRPGLFNYKVIENPIPIEFLLFEIKEKDMSSPSIDFNPIRMSLGGSPLLQTPKSTIPAEGTLTDQDTATYSFKVRYAGQGKSNAHTLLAKSDRERSEWINYLSFARSNLCSRIRKFEPFHLESISSTNFAYEWSNRITKLQVCVENDPLESIVTQSVERMNQLGFSGDIYGYSLNDYITFSKILCSTAFDYGGSQIYFLGSSNGIYCGDLKNRWKRLCNCSNVTKIEIIPNLNLVFVLTDKKLRYYHLDSMLALYYECNNKLKHTYISSSQVSFFSVGVHRGVQMLFYAKKRNNSGLTIFKTLIPEIDTDGIVYSFRNVGTFYIQADCYDISIFNSSFIVHTNKGFDVLNLETLLPRPIPEIPTMDSIKQKKSSYGRRAGDSGSHPGIDLVRRAVNASNSKPMGVFKLNNNTELLLVYSDFAIFTNKHGKLSRYSLLKFDYKAKSICFKSNYLFVATDDVLEVWSISDFVKGSNKLVQVIVGKDINIIGKKDELFLTIANPKVAGLEMVLRLESN